MTTQPFPYPQESFETWAPENGGRRTVPAPANALTSYPTLRVQNNTRGTVYITENIGSIPDATNFTWRVGPYSSETLAPNAQGIEAYWEGVAGSGETVGFQWSAVSSSPGGSDIGQPYFSTSQTVSWLVPQTGGSTLVTRYLKPDTLGLTVAGTADPGQTIVSLSVENDTPWTLLLSSPGAGTADIGVVEPFTSTTFQCGMPTVEVNTLGPNVNRSGVASYVRFTAHNNIPVLDPAAKYQNPVYDGPSGTMLQVSKHDVYGAAGGTLYTVTQNYNLIIKEWYLSLDTYAGAAGTVVWFDMVASQGLNGLGTAERIAVAQVVTGVGNMQTHVLSGPIVVPSLAAPYAANAIQVRQQSAYGGSVQVSAGFVGWLAPGVSP